MQEDGEPFQPIFVQDLYIVAPPVEVPIEIGMEDVDKGSGEKSPWDAIHMSDYFSTDHTAINVKVPFPIPKSQPSPRYIIEIPSQIQKNEISTKPVFQIPTITVHYTKEEIQNAADKTMQGKEIDMSDPVFVSEIIEELTSRRIQMISDGMYKKAQLHVDKINYLRSRFRIKDAQKFREEHLTKLTQQRDAQRQVLVNTIRESKSLIKTKKATCKQLFDQYVYNQENERSALIESWRNVKHQRQFNKQSPELLASKALEKYMALAGALEEAEEIKKKNKKMEKIEIKENFDKMTKQFEKAQELLEEDLAKNRAAYRKDLEFSIDAEVQRCKQKIEKERQKADLLDKFVIEEQKLSKSMRNSVLNAKVRQLPMLQRTGENIIAKNKMKYSAIDERNARPLELPPLVVKRRKIRGMSSQF